MKFFLNYLGQLRLYSLADLVLLLVVLDTPLMQLIGVVILHISFLVFLENKHSHEYRKNIPKWISWILALIGVILFKKVEGILYLIASLLYIQKNKKLGGLSPVFRFCQMFFIVSVIIGYDNTLTYIIASLFLLRNLIGDFRDVERDIREGIKTLPVIIGNKRSIPNIHLVATILTSFVWWSISSISIIWLILVIVIQITTYNLTPRGR